MGVYAANGSKTVQTAIEIALSLDLQGLRSPGNEATNQMVVSFNPAGLTKAKPQKNQRFWGFCLSEIQVRKSVVGDYSGDYPHFHASMQERETAKMH